MSHPEVNLTIEDLTELLESGKELAAAIDLEELLNNILLKATKLTLSPDGCVILYDSNRTGLYFAAAAGQNAEFLLTKWGENSPQRVPLDSKAGNVFQTGTPIVVNSIESDPGHYKGVDQQTGRRTESMICVPLSVAKERIGVMQVLNKKGVEYTERDRLLLESFAGQAAVAIRNARLYRELLAHMGLYASYDRKTKTLDVLSQLNRQAHSERLTLMFADMRGSTALCNVLNDPEKTQLFFNQFLTMLAQHVVRFGGVVNKFLGDGLFAFFGQPDSAKQAVTCAFEMIDKFVDLKELWDKDNDQDLSFLDIGVGIVTDNVIVGSIGADGLRDFTAIGAPVNLANAFESAARGGKRILVDQATYLAVKDIVGESEGPTPFDLRKPDQPLGRGYKVYNIKSLTSKVVFVSYSHEDRAFVKDHIYEPLSKRGFRIWWSGGGPGSRRKLR